MKRLASSLYWGETFFYDDNAEVVYESETASLSPTLAQMLTGSTPKRIFNNTYNNNFS